MNYFTNRSIVVLITLLGFAGVFAIAYSGGGDPRLASALQILLLTLTVFVAGYAVASRNPAALLMAGGLAAWSIDTFYPHDILSYGGIALYLAGVFLMARRARATSNRAGI